MPTDRRMRPVVIASANGHQHKNGGTETCVERAFRLMTQRCRRPRRAGGRRHDRRARPRRQQRGLRRPAQCGRRRAARCELHARTAAARRRRRGARRLCDGSSRCTASARHDVPSPARGRRRSRVRPRAGVCDRRRLEVAAIERALARMAAPHRGARGRGSRATIRDRLRGRR